jgi:hypothetical protein
MWQTTGMFNVLHNMAITRGRLGVEAFTFSNQINVKLT